MSDPRDEDDRALAAEWVAGLLGPDAAAEAARRRETDPSFAAEVARWQARAAALSEAEIEPVRPPRRLKLRLAMRLWGDGDTRSRSRLGPALLAGFVAGAAVGAIGALAVAPSFLPTPSDPGTADAFEPALFEIASEDASLRLVGAAAPGGAIRVRRIAGAPPEGRIYQLWAIGEDAAPVPLTTLEGDDPVTATLPEALRTPGVTLAVSDEPPGGSPTGAPTGEVRALAEIAPPTSNAPER